MKVLSFSALLVPAGVAAFTPGLHHACRSKLFRSTPRTCGTELNMVAIPNPLKKLPWNVQKEKVREERRLKQEGAKLYRDLGVAEDATFEEIQEATSILLARYEGDLKKRVKVEITKDKIMQLRLNQRLGGLMRENKDARASVYLQEDAEEFKSKPKEWEPPKWTKGLVVKPDSVWRDNCVIFFGGLAALGIFLPNNADGMRLLSFFLSAAFMAQRGTPEAETGTGMRGKVGKHTFLAFGLAFVIFLFVASLTSALASSVPGLSDSNFYYGFQNLIVAFCMGLATAYLQPYKKSSI